MSAPKSRSPATPCSAASAAMAELHERYHHRGPVEREVPADGRRTHRHACMGGVYSDVEKTMIEIQSKVIVQETRSVFRSPCSAGSSPRSSAYRDAACSSSSPTATSAPTSEVELFFLADTNARPSPR